jgi:hypothetical protein
MRFLYPWLQIMRKYSLSNKGQYFTITISQKDCLQYRDHRGFGFRIIHLCIHLTCVRFSSPYLDKQTFGSSHRSPSDPRRTGLSRATDCILELFTVFGNDGLGSGETNICCES